MFFWLNQSSFLCEEFESDVTLVLEKNVVFEVTPSKSKTTQ